MSDFDPAELARLADAATSDAVGVEEQDEFEAYCGTHRDAIVAALTRAQETEKAIDRVREAITDAAQVARCGAYMCGPEPVGVSVDEAVDILAEAVTAVDAALRGAATTTGDTP